MTLPNIVLSMVDFHPLEDIVLELLRARFPSTIPVQSLIADRQMFPFILVRRADDWGRWDGDSFVSSGTLAVHTFCEGLDADQDAALLGEAVRVALFDSINDVVPGKGHLTRIEPITFPRRMPDFATAVGPVQYADLPTGVVRYEARYDVSYRRPV